MDPCGRPATHVLDGLCQNCWTKNDQELKPSPVPVPGAGPVQYQGAAAAQAAWQALLPAHWRELWDKVKRSCWRTKSQQEQAEQALQLAEAEFLASYGPGARYELRSGGKRDRGEDPDARQVGGCLRVLLAVGWLGAGGCWPHPGLPQPLN
jgi:hypothetical protein